MEITPVSRSLDEIFRSSFIKIPRFQRPYSWDRENISDFWNDLVSRADDEYFMGSTVLFRDGKEKNLFSVVDGQQRLTTITIALSLIRNALDEAGEPDLADGIQSLLERSDIDNKLRYVIEHEPKNKFYQNAIQKRRPDPKADANSNEEQALRAALTSIRTSLAADLEKVDDTVSRLRTLRNRLLSLRFISIQLDDEDDAYMIFETLNTRGKDLRVSDLLKNHFTRLIKTKSKSHDVAKEKWQEVMTKLESVSPLIDPDTFFSHYWLAQEDYVSKANLFKSMRKVITASSAASRLDDIVYSSSIYTQAVAPSSYSLSLIHI